MNDAIRVLVVEDEPLVAEAHATYVGRVPGFHVTDVVHGGRDALRVVHERAVDVLLLDFNLPDLHGLEVCRALRARAAAVDVIAVTSVRDLASVRAAVSVGVVQYLLKPFTFASLRDKLERYAAYRQQVQVGGSAAGQGEVDRALASLRGVSTGTLPTGLSAETLEAVARAVQAAADALSAAQVAAQCGVSRVTARRYLEHLAESGTAVRRQRYGRTGRPEVEYSWTVG